MAEMDPLREPERIARAGRTHRGEAPAPVGSEREANRRGVERGRKRFDREARTRRRHARDEVVDALRAAYPEPLPSSSGATGSSA